jgi:Rod binding domain-containing protein
MTEEDAEFNRIEREAAMRKAAVSATVQKPMHPEIKKMFEDYFDRCFRESAAIERQWVGLTDKEIAQLEETTTCSANESWLRNLTRAIEAKLREKNT